MTFISTKENKLKRGQTPEEYLKIHNGVARVSIGRKTIITKFVKLENALEAVVLARNQERLSLPEINKIMDVECRKTVEAIFEKIEKAFYGEQNNFWSIFKSNYEKIKSQFISSKEINAHTQKGVAEFVKK